MKKRREEDEIEDIEDIKIDDDEIDIDDLALEDEFADDEDEFVDEDEYDEDDDEEEYVSSKKSKKSKKQPKQKKKSKTGKIIGIVAAVLVVVLVVGFVLVDYLVLHQFIFKTESQVTSVGFKAIDLEAEDNKIYVGSEAYNLGKETSTFNLASMLGADSISLDDSSIATLTGNRVKVASTGEVTGTVDGNAVTFVFVDGVNVTTEDEIYLASTNKKGIVLQEDLTLTGGGETKHERIEVSSALYGNNHTLDATNFNYYENKQSCFNIVLYVATANVLIQDLHVTGNNIEDGAELSLDIELQKKGMLIAVYSENKDTPASVTIKHCLLENANRCVYVSAASANIEDSIIRNAGDACISSETRDILKSELNLKNNLIGGAKVAGILFWGYTAGTTKANFPTLKIEGFLNIYNWKSTNDCSIMPDTETLAKTVNPIIQDMVNSEDYADYAYMYNNEKYIHVGIVLICSGSCKSHELTSNGMPSEYVEREFPVPGIAKVALHANKLYGYANSPCEIEPDDNLLNDSHLASMGFNIAD